jgi:hypothetical protein
MPIIATSSHGLLFDGVSDSVVVPQGRNTKLGDTTPDGNTASTFLASNPKGSQTSTVLSNRFNSSLTIEAWVMPDCGGTIIEKENQFSLKIGTVDTPGPCVFQIHLERPNGKQVVKLSTAESETNGYDGMVYPPPDFGGPHEPYNRFNSSYDTGSILNLQHRPLIHIVAALRPKDAVIYINGELVVRKEINPDYNIQHSEEHMYIGGKGGEFRGIMESLHLSTKFDDSMVQRSAPLKNSGTVALYRFEEPISPFTTVYEFNSSTSTVSGLTKILFSNNADAATLASELTGKTVSSGTIDFTSSTYSSGDYKVADAVTSPGTTNIRSIPHVPFNLLINPGAYDYSTKLLNTSPPERVRLHSINDIDTTPYMLVSSIHLDFANSSLGNGLRPVLHSRTSVDNHFVIISADLLIDGASGYPYQPLHYATQMIDRTGQMAIDEGPFEQHGIVYSSRMANTVDDTNNPFAVTWPTSVDDSFRLGHNGRHTLNHVAGHEFMRMLPEANEELVIQQIDGSPDIVEINYDTTQPGIENQILPNSRIDVYRNVNSYRITDFNNSSSIAAIVSNGLPVGSRELIGIGGADFDYRPFVLKGPVPYAGAINTETRDYHIRPSKESRIAVLNCPALSSYTGFTSTVLVYYNAIDLNGNSMGDESENAYLMVEKTIPAGITSVGGGSTVYDIISGDIANCTLYSPGGYIDVAANPTSDGVSIVGKSHNLVGDTSEGYEADDELDESFTPANYTPISVATAEPNTPPQIVTASHTTTTDHDSVFHRILLERVSPKNRNLNDKTTYSRREPSTVISSPSNGEFDLGTTSSHTQIHEMFDVIDNVAIEGNAAANLRFYIQPSNRERINQLYRLRSLAEDIDETNNVSLYFLMSKARISSVDEKEDDGVKKTVITCYGSNQSIVNQSVSKTGKGSPDSHVVKEIEPNAPVVTVTLGGLGQGGSDIRPTYDPSILSRHPFSTQRSFHVNTKSVSYASGVGTLNVVPINNNSTDMASWGTYGFAKIGRVYLDDGSNALYDSKNGTSFTFTDSYSLTSTSAASTSLTSVDTTNLVIGMSISGSQIPANTIIESIDSATSLTMNNAATGIATAIRTFTHTLESSVNVQKYTDAVGKVYSSFENWLKGLGKTSNVTLSSTATSVSFVLCADPFFGTDSFSEDGTTVNDRMFQSGSSVNHDYQLGTQYASTRAMVEIPIFEQQIFDNILTHTYPGPDNSLKFHIDATYTAHSWNPSPVGKRPGTGFNSDRAKHEAYSYSISKDESVNDAIITQRFDTSLSNYLKLYVTNHTQFPAADSTNTVSPVAYTDMYQSIDYVPRFRRIFLRSGAWALYDNDPAADGYIRIPDFKWGATDAFRAEYDIGLPIFMSGALPKETLIPIGYEPYTKSVAYENRSIFYYDAASAQTQGGNVDYGLRQYVSAVEFKAGPESNPHAARIKPKRATGEIQSVVGVVEDDDGSDGMGIALVSLLPEDLELFPDFGFDYLTSVNFSVGDFLYEIELDDDGTTRRLHYYGRIRTADSQSVAENTIALGFYNATGTTVPSWLAAGKQITLSRRSRAIINFNRTNVSAIAADSILDEEYETYCAIATDWGINSTAGSTSVTITSTETTPLTSNTLGANLRVGDHVFATGGIQGYTALTPIGTISEISARDFSGSNDYTVTLTANAGATATGCQLYVSFSNAFVEDPDAILNRSWVYPYAGGGLRNGDTIWCNMTLNNPHAMEGLFSKSRGVLNENRVWKGFTGGTGTLSDEPRDSVPLENFLIGENCLETARNYVQHVNKTIEENYKALGLTAAEAPTIAYLDPYLAAEGHARVLLYDVGHDREFIAFQDIHMQVQSSAATAEIGWPRKFVKDGALIDLAEYTATLTGGGPSWATTQLDVANGFPSQNPYLRATQQSKFIESAYAHDIANRIGTDVLTPLSGSLPANLATSSAGATSPSIYGKAHGHHVHLGYSISGGDKNYAVGDSIQRRTSDETLLTVFATVKHEFSRIRSFESSFVVALKKLRVDTSNASLREPSTFFDTPDGTRVIPAFLSLKGVRNTTLDLSNHDESRLEHLPHWTQMDFVRRLTIDLGEVGESEGVTNIQSAANEVIRRINQAAAPKSSYQEGGSAHDPAPWWDENRAFASKDRGTHMGYIRAHIGREVQDRNGNKGFTIVIHSTVPGASGRNFCVWLDNSKGQSAYKPEFIIGHGGRWRSFWGQPDEVDGENMHPAPMPLDKNGRPFAPITTLHQLTNEANDIQPSLNSDFAPRNGNTSSPVLRAISNATGGSGFNSVNAESFESTKEQTLTEGLRTGTHAFARINFGGLTQAGVPGWKPSAGNWGMGRNGDKSIARRYGNSSLSSYGSYVPDSEISNDKIGSKQIYGIELENHKGQKSRIRFIYSQMGTQFENNNTKLPETIDEEVCVFFDDRGVGQGGFTLGHHMVGIGDATGRLTGFSDPRTDTQKEYYGGLWNPVPAKNIAVHMTTNSEYIHAPKKLVAVLSDPYDSTPTKNLTHTDLLGYLGFPKTNGRIQLTNTSGSGDTGLTLYYENRTQNDFNGPHEFYGITSELSSDTSLSNYLISPTLNWTTLITDELLCAVTAAAINAVDVNEESGVSFDCREMLAADGRTFGEWGVKADSIRIRTFNPNRKIIPISEYFSAEVHQDYGIRAAHLEYGEIEKSLENSAEWAFGTSRAITDANLDAGRRIDCGYIPMTLLQIKSKSFGPNSNSNSPTLIDSLNEPVNNTFIDTWRKNLNGNNFTKTSGDHILPAIDNPSLFYQGLNSSSNTLTHIYTATTGIDNPIWGFLAPACKDAGTVTSISEVKTVSFWPGAYVTVEGHQGSNISAARTVLTTLIPIAGTQSIGLTQAFRESEIQNSDKGVISFKTELDVTQQIDGIRSIGSVDSPLMVKFSGGRSSADHSVPVFFGGGFSGVVLDVNDGTMNDYSDFYTHPYASGPTGVAGIQNANEIVTSHAILDANAMMAFFPGTPLLNQHRGSLVPPAHNRDNILSPDLDSGSGTINSDHPNSVPYSTNNTVVQKPSPLVLRFAHPTARYEDHANGTENKTTYIIFGPGQSFPFTQEIADSSSINYNTAQPHPGRVVTAGNGWSSVPEGTFLPNHIENDEGDYMPLSSTYHTARNRFHWRTQLNWETAAGKTIVGVLNQRPESGRMYGQLFVDGGSTANNDDTKRSMPLRHNSLLGFGIATGADMVFHMDGGYHPGGNWMDNQITFNPPHPKSDTILTTWGASSQLHPTAYRVAGPITTKVLDYAASEGALVSSDVDMEYIIVDATRCQNGNELATVLGAAINSFPGAGALKAIGGTHMPSMGNAMRQDRYGWVELDTFESYNNSSAPNYLDFSSSTITTKTALEQIPACGWLKADRSSSTTVPAWASYHSREVFEDSGTWKVRFYLAPNRVSNNAEFESYLTLANPAVNPTISGTETNLYVWSKAGVHRFNNENASSRDHMCQTHFSGLVDAIDRTRPIGAVGWHGERYSYLNSLKIGTEGYSAGLGAWHSELAFSPYGTSSSMLETLSHMPIVAPLARSPESLPPVDGIGSSLMTYINDPYDSSTGVTYTTNNLTYARKDTDDDAPDTLHAKPVHYDITSTLPADLAHPQGLFGHAFLVVASESEFALIAKKDRDGSIAVGDFLISKGVTSNKLQYAGTTKWDERFHSQDRFIAPAHAGPNIEALIVDDTALPSYTTDLAAYTFHTGSVTDLRLENANPDRAKTGDLITDLDFSLGSKNLESGITAERNVVPEFYTGTAYTSDSDYPDDFWKGDVHAFDLYKRTSALNFSTEHIVWKRMDGGNLSLPALNARGLGAVPWTTRVESDTAYTHGEKIYGNVRFSFETTNSAMFPLIQNQELQQPQLADKHREITGNVLVIPNEEIQFEQISVVDDSGETHIVEGGSPLGTVIRTFRVLDDRGVKGSSPSLANSGNKPSLMVSLPDPETIPGNILVRSGFDPIMAHQNETFGSGGVLQANLDETQLKHLFDSNDNGGELRLGPTYENLNWEHIDPVSNDSIKTGWVDATENAPLKTTYELHDRTLFFHVTKMGHSHTHRYPTTYTHSNGVENQVLTGSSWDSSTSVLTVNATINTRIYDADFGTKEVSDDRRFIRIYNPTTEESVVASYTGISGTTFTGVVGDVDFTDFIAAQTITDLKIVPSYYMPAGSARFYAAQRMRDHAEVSGASPDMAHTQYFTGVNSDTEAHTIYTKPVLTPMPYPRMGHHFVSATMTMLPGHWAHPAYQSVYRKHFAENSSIKGFRDRELFNEEKTPLSVSSDISSNVTDKMNPLEPEIFFSGMTATPSTPSDIHGGAFTLMFETSVKWDGYGVLGSRGNAGVINKAGGHTIVLEAATKYSLQHHFPDPREVGAYQIVIQPNLFDSQVIGYHYYNSVQKLTSQQVHTVIGTEYVAAVGALVLYLDEATQADVRGCEVFINEIILDQEPDFGSQFNKIPPLSLFNPFGVEMSESPSFTRRAFPYSKMFSNATPSITLNIPWWSILHKVAPDDSSANGFRHLSQIKLDNYYEVSRSTFGNIGMQLTIAGYPSVYPDIYSHILQNTSLNPKATVVSSTGTTVTVDDASIFPETPYYGQKLEYVDSNGKRRTSDYTRRSGLQNGTVNVANQFTGVSATGFVSNIVDGETVIRLTRAYDTMPSVDIFTKIDRSIFATNLDRLKTGTKDTSNLHIPDAYLCMWHHNLGRPYTFYSDSARTWNGDTNDRAIDKQPYNSMPEHFETFRYQDAIYGMSLGPFDLKIKTPNSTKDGSVTVANSTHSQAGQDQASNYIMLNRFWPCGSRGGPHSSRPDVFVQAAASWIVPRAYGSDDLYRWYDNTTIGAAYSRTNGITKAKITTGQSYRLPFGYRISLRQAINKPRWGLIPTRAALEDAISGVSATSVGFKAGPLVQIETRTWNEADGGGSKTYPTTYVGIMERLTNFAGQLGTDKYEVQVRRSDGRRMTRPFGSPVRTLRNNNQVERDWWGDEEGKGITRLVEASQYYMVDWWGNTRGEAVRRAPVRGFGIRPAWDCGDAYEYDRTNGRTPYQRIWNNGKPIFNLKNVVNSSGEVSVNSNFTIPRFGGRLNDDNTNLSTILVDVFAPTHALRIGDMGGGRGVRYPTAFNEDLLTEISAPIHTTGMVLSHNTAEPTFGEGLLRPRNDVLQADEIPRGISARLEIAEDGLLKPEAVVSDRVEEISGSSPHKDAVSRSSPRIGIDAETIEGTEKSHIVINTEAHSLHTDRNVGQRTVLHGAYSIGSQSLGYADYTNFSFNNTNGANAGVLKFSHTSNMRPLGGDYILEARNFAGLFDDTGWGVTSLTGSNKTTNPYQDTTTYTADSRRNNDTDKTIQFLVRPVRVLDKNHVEIFRSKFTALKQSDGDYFQGSAGGKYGLFVYNTPSGRTATTNLPDTRAIPNTNGPYMPIIYMSTGNDAVPSSMGANLLGTEVTNFNKDTLFNTVCRLVITENTLLHHRSDAPRRKNSELIDYNVKPRFSQSLHPKGHKADVDFGTSDHTGDAA